MSARTRAATFAPGLLLALVFCAGEAAAQDVCRGGPYTGATGAQIECVDTSGSTDIVIDPGSVNVARIHGDHRGAGDIIIRIKPGVTITGSGGNSVLASRRGTGDVSIVITGGTLTGIASSTSYGAPGTVSVSMSGGTLSGRLGAARNGGTGNSYVTVSGDATIRSTATNAYGVFATNNGLGDELSVRMTGGSVETTGSGSHGIFVNASNDNGATAGPAMSVDLEGGSVRTRGNAHGVFFASYRGSRDASFSMTGGSVVTEADNVHSVDFWLRRFATGQTASARMTGGSIVAEGLGGRGLASLELYYGSLDVMTGAGATIAAPFAVGMEGLLEVNASATGRLVFEHGGAVSARDVGVLARAARASGHTRGAGAQWADDTARTIPMIHVTSSGDVTVGASVSDAFIRNRIAGADETLSTGEQAVLSAITEGDSDALTTALEALPDADYDAAWKAEAEDLRRKRAASSADPTGDGPLAQRAGEEILGLSRAGVRAYALSHTAIVDHVRAGDALSDAERAVLDAVLTKGVGSELEAALTALTGATYTTSWKNTVRQLAATYNAGDIQVDVTGGTIAAEGNGVEALYAVLHERNGAITVTVAEGARITGGAKGVHVRGGGAMGGVRNQRVTVNGRVTGGTGAGVYLGGGGTVSVGASGEVGATSGDGILADGGDLMATVSGTVTGDVRVNGGGDLTATVHAGGVVTGTLHDPQTPYTVGHRASIGRLLYASGGTVTVSGGGTLTGVEGVAVESTAGALSVTVNDEGRVEGDLKSGGTLMANVMAGGVVTGTIHDPQTSFTVGNGASIGRLLYANGATVTVSGGGTLTGVEVEGRTVAIQSTAGALSVTVNDEGRVEGDLESGGTLTANVMSGGVVTGTIHDPQTSFTVGNGASIGRLLYANGATVTVSGGGTLTGVEVEGRTVAIQSTAGALSVTVNDEGRVEGDVKSGGTLTANVMSGGVVTGTIHDPQASFTVGNGASIGRILYASGGTVTVAATGALTGVEVEGRSEAIRSEAGDLDVSVAAGGEVKGDLRALGDGDLDATISGTLTGDVFGLGAGEHTVTVSKGGTVTGTVHLASASTVRMDGTAGRVRFDKGGTVTVAGTGKLTGVEVKGRSEAIRSEAGDLDVSVAAGGEVKGDLRALGEGDLDATISGTLTGDVFGLGAGEHTVTVPEGGTVTGTVHLAASTVSVHGRAGRVRFDKGGTVTVGNTGWITGIEVGGRSEAIRNAAEDLDLRVTGRVTGDVRALGDGDLRATVAGTLTGDVIEEGAGNLSATVTGTLTGDVLGRGAGEHVVTVSKGGTVTGTVHLASASTVRMDGRAGQVRFDNGGTVTVAGTGKLTGVEVEGRSEAIRSEAGDLDVSVAAGGEVKGDLRALGEGDLDATISGTLTGDVFGLGAGEHTVTVPEGGTVTGTVHLSASTVSVHGRAGRVHFDQGGTVTVGGTGWITGIEGVAIRNAAGELVVSVAGGGRVTGDVIDQGARPTRVTTGPGSTVKGSIDVAAADSEVTTGGTVTGNVRFRRGGMVTVGPDGKVEGRVSSDRGGELVAVAEVKPGEKEAEALERAFPGELVEEGGTPPTIRTRKEGEAARSVGAPGTMAALVDGAWDVGVVERKESGAFRVERELAPRSRVYEALPSVVLGLNGLRGYGERMAAPRSAKGGWARVDALRGKWEADASTSGVKYRHRRHGVAVGLAGALGEEARFGASLHHRRGTAKVTKGGDVELYGTGAGVSGTWTREKDYLDVQAAMTWYEADLTSSSRGVLRKDVSGHGHALGVEAGRRMELEHLPAGMVLIPRVGLVHSQVSMDAFSDVTGARVSVDDARSLRGRAGVDVEAKPGGAAGSRVFASVEVEHELSTERKVRVSGTELESEAEATWLRLGLNGAHTWEEGRYTLAGGVGYATSGDSHELGGGLSLNLRF